MGGVGSFDWGFFRGGGGHLDNKFSFLMKIFIVYYRQAFLTLSKRLFSITEDGV